MWAAIFDRQAAMGFSESRLSQFNSLSEVALYLYLYLHLAKPFDLAQDRVALGRNSDEIFNQRVYGNCLSDIAMTSAT